MRYSVCIAKRLRVGDAILPTAIEIYHTAARANFRALCKILGQDDLIAHMRAAGVNAVTLPWPSIPHFSAGELRQAGFANTAPLAKAALEPDTDGLTFLVVTTPSARNPRTAP